MVSVSGYTHFKDFLPGNKRHAQFHLCFGPEHNTRAEIMTTLLQARTTDCFHVMLHNYINIIILRREESMS